MDCINKSSKEFKELVEGSEMTPFQIEIFVSSYQKKFKTDKFPTLNELERHSIKKLKGLSDISSESFLQYDDDSNKGDITNLYSDNTTYENKYSNVMDKIKKSLDVNIKTFRQISKRLSYTNTTSSAKVLKYANDLTQVQSSIQDYRKTNSAESLLIFSRSMRNTLAVIEGRFKKITYDNLEEAKETFNTYNNYLTTYSVAHEVNDLLLSLEDDPESTVLSLDEIKSIKNDINISTVNFINLEKKAKIIGKNIISKELEDINYFPEITKKYLDKLKIEYRQLKISQDKDTWINDKLYSDDIQNQIDLDLKAAVLNITENHLHDIWASDALLSSGVNVSSKLVQILNKMLVIINNERTTMERDMDQRFIKVFDNLKKDKGTNNIKKLYENLIEVDKEGKPFLKGNHSLKLYSDVIQPIYAKRNSIKYLKLILKAKLDKLSKNPNAPIYTSTLAKYNKQITELQTEIKNLENSNFKRGVDGDISEPNDSWKTKTSSLSKAEKEALDFFTELSELNNEQYNGKDNLIKYNYKTKFYELPKIYKSSAERTWTGNIKDNTVGRVTDAYSELTEDRPDDYGYVTSYEDFKGNPINTLKAHYRDGSGNFKHKDQSLDLMTSFRKDYKASNSYKIRKKHEIKLKILLDVAKNKSYYSNSGTLLKKSTTTDKLAIKEGDKSNTYKMMNSILETGFYDILSKNDVKLNKYDLNKAVGYANKGTAFLALSFNIASGTANVVNSNAQLFLESFIKGDVIKAKSIAKANALYSKHMVDTIKDTTRPVNLSYTNQIAEIFNTSGLFNLSEADFLKTDLLKKGISFESLQIFQNTGENWMQSIIAMSVLDGVEIMDVKGNFINKDGKIVKTKKEAASLLDMLKQDPITGIVNLDSSVEHTSYSRFTKWNEGGKANIDLLIRKKLYDTIGNYTQTDQAEIMRHWWGKWLMLFRKYLIPMGLTRFRGLETSAKNKKDLQDHERRFSDALQEYEEGTYTTLIRFAVTSLKDKKLSLALTNWSSLSDHEKNNIRKSTTEIVMTFALLPLLSAFTKALADDDDNEYLFFIAYQIRRLETELSAYRDPREFFKMLRSPIPSLKLMEDSISIIVGTFSYSGWTDEVLIGENKGENKLLLKIKRTIPVVKEFERTYKKMTDFQNRSY